VRLAEETFANHAYRHVGCGCFNSCTQPRAAGTDDQNIVLESLIIGHGLTAINCVVADIKTNNQIAFDVKDGEAVPRRCFLARR
jgi:hypothetical protein